MGWTSYRGCSSVGYSFIHSVVCLTTGPKSLPKQALHIVRSKASSFKWEYPLLSLRSTSGFLRLPAHLPVTSIPPFIFPSITRCRRQFLLKMWPIQLAFRLLISCRIFFCSSTLCNTSSFLTRSVQLIFSILLQHHIYVTQNKCEYRQISVSYFLNKFRAKWTEFDWRKRVHYKHSTQISDCALTLSWMWAHRYCGDDP